MQYSKQHQSRRKFPLIDLKRTTLESQEIGRQTAPSSRSKDLENQISDAVDEKIIENNKKIPKRNYIGASSIGEECSRKIQYRFMNYPSDPEREFTAKTLRIFQFGHEIEDYAAKWLRDAEFDLKKLNASPSLDMTLAHQDRIVIPPMQKVVYLFGDFKKPTNLAFNPNSSIKDYIEMAGGLNESSRDELIVIDPSGVSTVYRNKLFFSNKVELYPGSIVYASRDIGKVDPVRYVASVSPILSSLALSLASLNSIQD